MPEHSKTVRGTFDNPKTEPLLQKGNDPSRLGDPVSLRSEKTAGNSNSSTSRSASGDPYRQNEGAKGARKVNPTQLGDPASLTAETSGTELGRDVESVGDEGSKGGKSKL